MKLAVSGCPRNCAESLCKDVGMVAVDGGRWEIYVGGAAGAHIRKGDLLATVEDPEMVKTLTGRFMQYYRENANWLERTYAFVPRVGVDVLRKVFVQDSLVSPNGWTPRWPNRWPATGIPGRKGR